MTANELAESMEIRASIRRKATSRKSVQEGANDRLADQLEQAATMLRKQQDRIGVLEANHKIQLDINKKALQYIEQLEQGLRASINLNRAQNERTKTTS